MIEHLVFLKPKPTAQSEDIARMNRLEDLGRRIPEVKEISAGVTFTDRSQGHTVGLRVLFETPADLETYLLHPAHVEVVEQAVKPLIESVMALDYHRRA